jgi:hypothetical protein
MAFAFCCWSGAALVLGAPAPVAVGGATLAAVAAPQCDLDNLGAWSRVTKSPKRKEKPVRWALSKVGVATHRHPVRYRIALILTAFAPHRQGPAHSVITAAVAGVLLTLPMLAWPVWPWWTGAAAATGLISHIVLDLANEDPVRVFYPFGPLVYGLGIKVGKAWEILVIRPGCYAAALGLLWLTLH